MKRFLTLVMLMLCVSAATFSQVGIGTDSPDASAVLHLVDSARGFLLPRLTTAQRNAIASPATGLLIYQTDGIPGLYYYRTGWRAVTPTVPSAANRSLSNLTAPTAVNTHLRPDSASKRDLGDTSKSWRNLFIDGDIFTGGYKLISTRQIANTLVGLNTGAALTSGSYNTALGYNALSADSTGGFNTATGTHALANNSSGNNNSAYGYTALLSNTTGNFNTAHGFGALSNNTTASNNTAMGAEALASNTTGTANTATGTEALKVNTTGGNNTATGFEAMLGNTTGIGNQAFGAGALYANTTGSNNVAMGMLTLNKAQAAFSNTGIGSYALFNTTTGGQNTATGSNALYSTTTGFYNTAAGYQSLYSNTAGVYNTANGSFSLFQNATGNYNTGVGQYSLYYTATTSENAALGYSAGDYTYNATQGTFLGSQTRAGSDLTNITAVGYGATVNASNAVRVGNTAVTSIGGQVGWTSFSDGRFKKNIRDNVPGIEFIKQLHPVTYNLDVAGIDNRLQATAAGEHTDQARAQQKRELTAAEINAREAKSRIVYSGFIAQEVEQAAQRLHYDFSGVDAPKNASDFYGLRYAEFVVPMVKAMQEQQKEIEDLQASKATLETNMAELKARLEKLEKLLSNR